MENLDTWKEMRKQYYKKDKALEDEGRSWIRIEV